MVDVAQSSNTAFRDARKSALMTQADLAEKLGVGLNKLAAMEKEPESMTLAQMREWYHLMMPDGKAMIERFVSDCFLH